MAEGKFYLPWPDENDEIIVKDMRNNPQSEQWNRCNRFVTTCVQTHAKNLPEQQEDIIQDAMERVTKSLPTFRYNCKLKTWIFIIVRNCIVDAYRKLKNDRKTTPLPEDPHEEHEYETTTFSGHTAKTTEDEAVFREEIKRGLEALEEYIATHANRDRNRQILQMVIFEGRTLEETAQRLNCSAPIVGYIVREAQKYARKKGKGAS
jgi:RNA polymerase sigma factor (sigma-70 family)